MVFRTHCLAAGTLLLTSCSISHGRNEMEDAAPVASELFDWSQTFQEARVARCMHCTDFPPTYCTQTFGDITTPHQTCLPLFERELTPEANRSLECVVSRFERIITCLEQDCSCDHEYEALIEDLTSCPPTRLASSAWWQCIKDESR